jgi:hypothetical protein
MKISGDVVAQGRCLIGCKMDHIKPSLSSISVTFVPNGARDCKDIIRQVTAYLLHLL